MHKLISGELMAVIRREFALDLDGIHGISHWERVRVNGLRLAKSTGADTKVIELFAFLHDVKRQDNGPDTCHGRRAAEFIETIRHLLVTLPDCEYELLRFACAYHNRGLTEADVTVQTCWDADRLDLGRIGLEPVPSYLCTSAAKEPAMIRWAFLRSILF
jgi:uncharacterized protein